MPGPLEGFEQIMSGYSRTVNVTGFRNIEQLDNFLENPDQMLKGSITKVQQDDQELVSDLKALEGAAAPNEVIGKFQNVIGKYLDNVNEKHKAAEKAVETLATGGNIDVHSVMIAAEKASLSMQLTLQLRNKILQAYRQIEQVRV